MSIIHSENTDTSATLELEDLEVIKSVCEWYLPQGYPWNSEQKGYFVIIMSESNPNGIKDGIFGPNINTTDTLSMDFINRNIKPFRMQYPVRKDWIMVVGSSSLKNLVKERKESDIFTDTKGFIFIWLPGYNKDKTEALVYAYHTGSDTESRQEM